MKFGDSASFIAYLQWFDPYPFLVVLWLRAFGTEVTKKDTEWYETGG
ncbi:MAG: hypothetical protein ABIK99_04885 [candidate division WOR-3 bacterium]